MPAIDRKCFDCKSASKRCHLLELVEVLPWLNFTPDTQQVPAERFSYTVIFV